MKVSLFVLALTLSVAWAHLDHLEARLEAKLEAGIQGYMNNVHDNLTAWDFMPEETKFIPGHFMKSLMSPVAQRLDEKQGIIVCTTCKTGVNTILRQLNNGVSPDQVQQEVVNLCKAVLPVSDIECEGYTAAYWPFLYYMYSNPPGLTADRLCGFMVKSGCGDWNSLNAWDIVIPGGKPPVETPTLPAPGSPTMKFLQLTDVHMDLTYTLGSSAENCGLTICCNDVSGPPTDPADEAGYWGDNRCDIPEWTYRDMLMHIARTHTDLDYIILTGDYPAHDLWRQTLDGNLFHQQKSFDAVKEIFPNTPVYVSVGNHDTAPSNMYGVDIPDPAFSSQPYYDRTAEMLSQWLPQSALDTFRQNGFYSVLVQPGFRIIAVNSNWNYVLNLWLNRHWVDPAGHLAWLANELQAAELAGERVHILSHIPMGRSDTTAAWGREFAKLMDRFENTVVGQFYGHTHYDEFLVFYDFATNSRATNVAYVSPAVATWTNLNPAYRIFTMDGDYPGSSRRIIDVQTYIADLAAANLQPGVSPTYFQLYDHRRDLEMPSLFPADFDTLARRLATDNALWTKFFNYWNSAGTEADTRRNIICDAVTTNLDDQRKCNEIMGPGK